MTEHYNCFTCGTKGRIVDSAGGFWTCPRCSGYGIVENIKPKNTTPICSEHNVEMKWVAISSGYWVCPIKEQH